MRCQLYNPAAAAPAGEGTTFLVGRFARRLLLWSAAILLLPALHAAPAAAQMYGGPVYGPPVMAPRCPQACPPALCPLPPCPQHYSLSPVIIGQPSGPVAPAWPPAIGAPQPVTAYYPPAPLEDAGPLLQQVPGAVRVIVPEAFLNRLLARSETDTGPVVDNILGANVTGSQYTNTTITVDVLRCAQLARMELQLNGTTVNQTIGVTPQAAVRSRGTHDFRLTKQVDFDGLQFSTRSPAAWVTPRLTNEGAATPLTGVPLLGPLANQIALNQAQQRRPAAEQVITRRLTDQVAPRFNQEVDQQLSDANVRLQRHIPTLLGLAGLTPADVSFSSTDAHVLFGLCVPQVQTSRRPAPDEPPSQSQDSQSPQSQSQQLQRQESPAQEPQPQQSQKLPVLPPGAPLSDTSGPQTPQPTESPSNRPPVLLAPIEPDDPPAVDEPAPSTEADREEGEFTVIRQISDVPAALESETGAPEEASSDERPWSLSLPQLEFEPEPDLTQTPPPTNVAPAQVLPLSILPTGLAESRDLAPPPSLTAGASFTLALHESAINYALSRAPLGGVRVPDRTIDRLLEQLRELLAGTPPEQLSLEGLGDEQPEFAAIVLHQENPLSVRFESGQVLVELVAAFEPLLTPAVPAQRIQIVFTLERDAGRVTLVPGQVTVEGLPGQPGGPMMELARPIIRQQVTQRLKSVEMPTSLPLNLPGLPALELTTRNVLIADGWLLIAVD
jgi:hypothetical protein